MHILQLGPYPPPEGGISRNILAIRDEVVADGNTCSIVATSRSSQAGDEPGVYHPRSALAVIKLLSSLDFDVLHLHIGGAIGLRVLALAFASTVFGRSRSILTLHSGGYPQTKEGRAARRGSLRGFVFRRFSQIIAVNEPIAKVFENYGVRADRMRVIQPYSPKLPDETVAVPGDLAEFSEKHSPLLIAVGGLERDYDPLLQIAAMKDILNDFPNAGLMIIGDGSMRKQVETAVSATGYAGNIRIAGNLHHAITLHLIRDADLLLRTTLFDGDAISVREALFLGTPVVATDNGMRPVGVHLIDIGDREALVRKVREVVGGEAPKKPGPVPESDNIAAVIEIYRQVAALGGPPNDRSDSHV